MKKKNGQSLIEMVVIIGIVITLATGIVAGTTFSLSQAQNSQARSTALKYAQDGIELARQLRDAGWTSFAPMGTVKTVYCVGADGEFVSTGFSCTVTNIGAFIRSVSLELVEPVNPGDVEKMNVMATVQWGDITNPKNLVQLTTFLTQWR